MLCHKCGQADQEQGPECSRCGAALPDNAIPEQTAGNVLPPAAECMSFGKAIITCLSKYADFNGRASRAEYWWFTLFSVLLQMAAIPIDTSDRLRSLLWVLLLLPALAVAARRLHDINRSGWWQLIPITVVGIIPLLIWLCSRGDRTGNRYGSPV